MPCNPLFKLFVNKAFIYESVFEVKSVSVELFIWIPEEINDASL